MMNLSERSIQVLKNFSTINPSIQFREGNVLKTVSPNKTMMAKANLDSSIERTFAIYDLSRFLGVVSLFEDPEFELQENQLNINSTGRSVSYTYADPTTIVVPPENDLAIGECEVSFSLSQSQYIDIMKALGVMSFPELVVAGENGNLVIRATDTKNPSADKYDIVVGSTDTEFQAVFKAENIKLMPDDYEVSISSRGIANFKSEDVEYWISIEAHSQF